MTLRLLACCLALVVAVGCRAADAGETRKLHELFDRQWQALLERYPEIGTFRGDGRFDDRLTDLSPAAIAAFDARTRGWRDEARTIRRDLLEPTDRVSLDMFVGALDRQIEQQAFEGWRSMRIGALGGAQTELAGLMQQTPVARRDQFERLLQRWAAYPRQADQEIALLRRGMALGWVPSRDVLERALAQLDRQLADGGPFYGVVDKAVPDLPPAERTQLQAAGRAAVETQVLPALRRLREFVAGEYMAHAVADGALLHYPDGARLYALRVREQTTTALTPEQIHAIGLRELARLRAGMEAVMREVRFDGGFAAFADAIRSDPRFIVAGPDALLARYRDIAKRIDAELPRLFAELPRVPYGVRAMPAHLGPNAAEFYERPAADGSRAGFFNANAEGWRAKPTWGMPTLVAHEAVPGHHLQIARALELRGLPEFRRDGFGLTAFIEGWALYAETLGAQIGLYDDPYARFGHLQAQAFRAARLVVDTGIHALGWPRAQAIDFMVENTGMDRGFLASEVDRYTSNPGQALAYMIGKLKIDELRDRARERLGHRFDLRRFHNAVIDQDALPLDTLERVVDEWVAAQPQR
jgi:uncharacterized protein (DUF885 family)